jgi:hypothetical protein
LRTPTCLVIRPDVCYEGNIVSFFHWGLCALATAVLLSVYVWVGVGFWRLHRDDFTRLSVWVLTHQPGLIANFATSRPRLLARANGMALDALSNARVVKVCLAWPIFVPRFRDVLEFARFSSRILGDERTDALSERLKGLGLLQADEDDVKAGERFRDGFLVRRLDEELVAVFWHESAEGQRSPGPRKVVPLRVPAERRIRAIAQAFQKWGLYSHVAEGSTQSRGGLSLPYVVIYEPHNLGRAPTLKAFGALARGDARRTWERLTGAPARARDSLRREELDPFEAFGFDVGGNRPATRGVADDEETLARRAENAYRRFLLSTRSLPREG